MQEHDQIHFFMNEEKPCFENEFWIRFVFNETKFGKERNFAEFSSTIQNLPKFQQQRDTKVKFKKDQRQIHQNITEVVLKK